MMIRMFRNVRNSTMWLSCALVSGASATAMAQGSLTPIPGTVPTFLKQSTVLRATAPSQVLHLAISLPSSNLAAFQAYVNDISNPKSPNFHKWLTPAQVGTKFGASNANLLQVENYLRAEGFKIKLVGASHMQILADATVFQAESAFHTTINNYHSKIPNDTGRVDYYSFATVPKAPSAIASKIAYVSGLQNHAMPIPRIKRTHKQAGPGYLTPSTTSVFYNSAPLHTAGFNGQGKTIAISNWDGFTISNAASYISAFSLPTPSAGPATNITIKTIDGGAQFGTAQGEGDLDFEMMLNQAPLANIIIYDGGGDEMDVIAQEANDNLADTLSESYGWGLDGTEVAAAHVVHLQMSAQGQTYMCATGDDGTNIQFLPEPDIEPEVTAVGGTTISSLLVGTRVTETGWSGSGGGWMTLPESFNVLPFWQVGPGVPTNLNFRLYPDLSMDADPNTGEQMYIDGGLQVVGGTSEASPLFAADLAVMEQFLATHSYFPTDTTVGNRFGRLNDLIYAQQGSSQVFFDCLSGSNGDLPNGVLSQCTPGWDSVTGWGALDFNAFVEKLIASPPITLAPTAVSIFTATSGPMAGIAQGTNLAGSSVSTLLAADGIGYVESSIPNEIGPIAASQMTFQLSTSTKNPVGSASLTFVQSAPSQITTFFYLKNVSTGADDLVGSVAMTGSNAKFTLPITLAKYVNSAGQVTLISRSVGPARLSNTPFEVQIDEASILETF